MTERPHRRACDRGDTCLPGANAGPVSPSTSPWPAAVRGHDARRGKTRQVKGSEGVHNNIFGYVDEQAGLEAGRLAVRLVNHLVAADPDSDFR